MTVLRSETQYPQNQGVKAQYMQQFRMLDPRGDGYVKLDQLKKLDKDPNAVTILALFAWADRDTNDKLTEKELSDFLDMAMSLHGAQAKLTFADNGQSLFELLDANRDGQLSIRELRGAWKRLEEFDRDKKGSIARNEIPRQYQLLVSQGNPFVNQNAQAGANFGVTVVQSIPTRGPLWTSTTTATYRSASFSARRKTSRRSTPTATASLASRRPRRPTRGSARR